VVEIQACWFCEQDILSDGVPAFDDRDCLDFAHRSCRENADELAGENADERRISDYYGGGDTPRTINEQYEASAKERREHDRTRS
jgi:hypothetical protein